MAWTETFHCDVCSKEKNEETEDWWLAWLEVTSPSPGSAEQAVMHVTKWNNFLAHSSEVRHLCGGSCVHTLMGRWMQRK